MLGMSSRNSYRRVYTLGGAVAFATQHHPFPQPHHTLSISISHNIYHHPLHPSSFTQHHLSLSPQLLYTISILYYIVIKTISNHIINHIHISFIQPYNLSIITISYSIRDYKDYITTYTRTIIIIIFYNHYNYII